MQRNKQYYNTHKEQVLLHQKKYVDENREEVKQWKSTKILCSCGGEYTQPHKSRHLNALRQKEHMEKQSTEAPEWTKSIIS